MNYVNNLLKPYKGLPREIYVIFIARVINALGCFVMPLLTIILTQRIGLSEGTAGLYISIAGLLYIPASMLGGKLADTVGRKKIIIIFDMLAAVLYIVCGLMAPSMNMAYVLMAAGACMNIAGPAHDSLIADLTTPENRRGSYALVYMGWNLGFAAGPVIAGMLYKNHLPWVFIGDALTAIISLGLMAIFIKETIGISKQEIKDESRALERQEEGSIFSVLFKRPLLIYFALIALGYNFVYSQWSFMLPIQSVKDFGDLGAKYYGLLASFNGAVVIFFTPLVTRISEGIKDIRRAVIGGLFYAAGFGMLGLIYSLPLFFLSAFIFTLGEIILSISVSPFIANHTPASHRGRMSSVLPVILGMGYTLGPMVMGKALTFISIETGWLILGCVALISSFLMRRLESYEKSISSEKNPEAYAGD
jgi:Arabinose efflux permease